MGLDMQIFRVTKPHLDDTLVYTREDIDGIILDEDELKEPMYRQLAPYTQPAHVRSRYYDMEKIQIFIEPQNTPSILLAKKLGATFYKEKCMGTCDSYIMKLPL